MRFKATRFIVLSCLLALLSWAPLAFSQVSYDTVTATVTDPDGQPLAGAQFIWRLVDRLGNPVSSATTPNGQIYNAKPIQGNIDANGLLSAGLVPNNILSKPSGTQWQVTITPPLPVDQSNILTYQPPWNITYSAVITASVDLSSQISALATNVYYFNTKTGQATQAGWLTGSSDPPSLDCLGTSHAGYFYMSSVGHLYQCNRAVGGTWAWNPAVGTSSIVYPSAGLVASTGSAWRAPLYSDVASLFSGAGPCFLKSDGTCANPTGGIASINGQTGPAETLESLGGTLALTYPDATHINLETVGGGGSGVQYNPTTTRNASIGDSRLINSTDVNAGLNQFTPSSYACNGTNCTVTGTGGTGWSVNDYGIIWWPVTPSCMQGSWIQVSAATSTTLTFPESQTQSCSGSISGSASGSVVWAKNTVVARTQAKPFFSGHGTSSLLLKSASGDGTVAEWDALVGTTITNWYTACAAAGGPCNLFVSLGYDDLFATPCSSYGTLTGSYTTAGSFRKFYNDVHAVGNINIITVTEPTRFSGGFCSNTSQDMIAVNQYLVTLSGPGAATTGQKDYADFIIDGATALGAMNNANYFDSIHYSNQGADVLASAINDGMAAQGSWNLGQPLSNGPNVMYGEQVISLPFGTNNSPVQGYGHNGSYAQDFYLQNVVGTPEWWVAGNFAYTFKWNSGTSAMWNATGSNGCWGWTSSTGGGAPDTCIWRASANVLSIGDANKASSNSSFKLTGIFGQPSAPSGTCTSAQGGMWQLTADGAITRCPSGGGTWTTFATGTGLSGMTAGQVPIAATATTITSSEPLAGAGAGITTGPTSATTAGHIATFAGTNGQIQDGGALSGTAPIVVSGLAISCPTCGTGSGGTSVSQNSGAAETNLPITGHMPQACLDSSGSGTAQVCTVANTFIPQANNCIVYKTTTANSGTGLTVNVNSLGAKSVAVAGSSGWTTTLVASSSIPAGKPMTLCYDGTNWDASGTGFAASGGSGLTFAAPYLTDGAHKFIPADGYQVTLPPSSPTWLNGVTPTSVTNGTNGNQLLRTTSGISAWASMTATSSVEGVFNVSSQAASGTTQFPNGGIWLWDSTNNKIYAINICSTSALGNTDGFILQSQIYTYSGSGNPAFSSSSNVVFAGAYGLSNYAHVKVSVAAGTLTFAYSLDGGNTFITTTTVGSIGTISSGGYTINGSTAPFNMNVMSVAVN